MSSVKLSWFRFKSLVKLVTNYSLRAQKPWQRFYSTVSGSNIHTIPLSQPLPWISPPVYAKILKQQPDVDMTVLPNGLKVATIPKFGEFCTIGVLIDSGSRYEVKYPSGIIHFLEKLAFSSTASFANRDTILRSLEEQGGICDCQGSRDTLIYALSASASGLDQVTNILSDVVLRPNVTEAEIEDARTAISFELETLDMRPDPEPLLVEMIHAAAYNDNTVGLPKICPKDNIPLIDRKSILSYMSSYHTADRMVLAGVGVEHEAFVESVKRHFSKQPTWETEKHCIDEVRRDLSRAQYTGGHISVVRDMSDVSLGPTPMPELAYVVIGLESCSHKDPDFVAYCVLNMMMGGGGSFSAGGPGKGMYTRLYLNVLNRYHWIHNATAFNHAYNDTGLFCIHASSDPSRLSSLVEVIVRELVNMQNDIESAELNRAKTQLQSMLLMNLESRPVVFEDVGRQILANGCRMSPQFYYDKIAKIQKEDVQRAAKQLLSSRPAVAALGDLSKLPSFESIQSGLISKDGKMPKKFSLFH